MDQEQPPVVTVVLPTNRGGKYLTPAVDSVLQQTVESWELIVVDDGAPPDVARGLDGLARRDPRIRVHHQANLGLSVARNVGASIGRGVYVTYLDDDDIWRGDRLEKQIAELGKHPEALLCYSAGWTIGPDGETLDEGWLPTGVPREDILAGVVDLPRIVTMVMRRDALLAFGGFNPAFRYCEDDEFILRMLLHGDFASVPDALVGYRRHAGNASGSNPVLRQLTGERIRLLQRWSAEAMGDTHLVDLVDANLARFRRRLADFSASQSLALARRGRFRTASQELRRALAFSPAGTAHTYRRKIARALAGELDR